MTNSQFPLHRYELTDLRVFLATADAQSLSRGAEQCHLAASSASVRIKQLEEAVGTPLFVRKARGLELTAAGRMMVEHVRRCLAQLQQMHSDLQPFTLGLKRHITVFANNNAVSSHLPTDLARYFAAHPDVRINLVEHLSSDIVAAVAAGRADVGVVAVSESGHPDLRFTPYKQDELVLLMASAHPLAIHGALRFSDCLHHPFISLQQGAALHTFLLNHAADLGAQLDVRVQVSGYRAIARLVGSGAGIGIVPKSALEPTDYQNLRIATLNEEWAIRYLHLCVHQRTLEAQPYLGQFIETLCAA